MEDRVWVKNTKWIYISKIVHKKNYNYKTQKEFTHSRSTSKHFEN